MLHFYIQDVLAADKQMANEVEFDLRKFEEQQEELERRRLEQARRRSGIVPGTVCLTSILHLMCKMGGHG